MELWFAMLVGMERKVGGTLQEFLGEPADPSGSTPLRNRIRVLLGRPWKDTYIYMYIYIIYRKRERERERERFAFVFLSHVFF